MKLLELNLIAYGPFSDCRIDLTSGQPGLHLIFGPNEAGKSSSLLAIEHLLYGFPRTTSVDFRHAYKNLRIGGRLRHSDDTELSVVRRKSDQKSLRCGADQEPVEVENLLPFLGEIDQALFKSMFGINHERLRSGGQEIAQGSGRIGEMLFAAGAGVVDLQKLQNNLLTQIEGLLKASGRSGAIHSGIQEYLLNRKAVDEALISVEAWNRLEEELRACRQAKRELDQHISEQQRELERLTRLKLATATIYRWRARQQNYQRLAHVPRLQDDFSKHADQLRMDLRTSEYQVSSASSELAKIEAQLKALVVSEEVLQAADRIEALRDRIGAIRAALDARTKVDTNREAFEREAKVILRELDRGPDLSIIDELRLPPDKAVKIQSLGNQLERLLERAQAERKNCDKLRREICTTQQRLDSTPAAVDVAEIRSWLRSIQQQGDWESDADECQSKIEQLHAQINLASQRLPLFNGELAQLETLPVPSPNAVDRYEDEFNAVDSELKALQQQLKDDRKELDVIQSRLTEMESSRAIPTLSELKSSRMLRDQGWCLIRANWDTLGRSSGMGSVTEGSHDSESRATIGSHDSESRATIGSYDSESRATIGSYDSESRATIEDSRDEIGVLEFMKSFPTATSLIDAYQLAVAAADSLADDLRHDADRVATKAKLQADCELVEARVSRRMTEIEQTQVARTSIETRWCKLWEPMGLSPSIPDDMHDWLRKYQTLLGQVEQLRQLELHREQLQQKIAHSRQRLLSKLQTLEPSLICEGWTLRELLIHLQDKIDAEQAMAIGRQQLADRLSEDRAELSNCEAEYCRTESEVNDLQNQWAGEMERLGLEKTALPAQANSRLNSLQSLFEKFREADRFRTRLEHIDRDARQFATDVAGLVEQVAPELAGEPFETAFQSLLGQLKVAQAAASQQSELLERHEQSRLQQSQMQNKTQRTQVALSEMMRQAKVDSPDELASAAEESRQMQELERQIAELENEIIGYAAGAGIDWVAFVAEVEQENLAEESIDARIATGEQTLQELREQRDAVMQQITSAEIAEKKFDGSGLAAEKNAVCESISSRLEEELHQLAVLRVASSVMKEAIERHRQKNQGPILGRASEIFRQITLGRFVGLQAEYNEKGEPVLAGMRASEERVLVNGMSDGTCDQLYLALRLASLESWLAHHEPMPFIVDDILMNFDDERSVATLKVLAELSRRTQVIFFTHHQHLVYLAGQHLSPADLFVTTLTGSNTNGAD